MPTDRPDLSEFIVHLTRNYLPPGMPARERTNARDNLLSILRQGRIKARTPYGIAVKHLQQIGCGAAPFMESQRTACFSETPLEYLSHLIDPGIWRRYDFQPYGLAFPRQYMTNIGANQLWYLNTYPGTTGFRWLAHDVNALIDREALDPSGQPDAKRWAESEIARLTPFIEPIGKWNTGFRRAERAKDFSWEREWRMQGDFEFVLARVQAIIVPVGEIESFRRDLAATLPMQGLIVRGLNFAEMESPGRSDLNAAS